MTYVASVDNLDRVIGFVEGCADRFGLKGVKKSRMLVAIEEALANFFHYAYPRSEEKVELACPGGGNFLVIKIADSGVAFNLLLLPDPNITADIIERKIGGLGVYLIRMLTDDVSCQRKDGRNILRMVLLTRNAAALS
jgi:anti-sigma regulatory factor (Ser/Thr protein kinase)